MKAQSKITEVELDFDQMTLERIPTHVQEHLRELKAQEKKRKANTFEIEVGGLRARITVELIE